MPVYIRHIETLAPENAYSQELFREKMMSWLSDERERRLVRSICRNSGIETRHSVLGDFQPGAAPGGLFDLDAAGMPATPGTMERNDRFQKEARRLSVEVARRAIEGCAGVSPADITHVITTTCTGFSNPGPDYYIVRENGLRASTERYALGFMGCYAAIPALRLAWQCCQANPAAVVLVVSIELCSLHLRFGNGMDSLLGNAIFADGTAAAVVSARPPAAGAVCRIEGFASDLIPRGEKDMAWRIGNEGFVMRLSTYVPDLIAGSVRGMVEPLLAGAGVKSAEIGRWAVHPGGKAILDKVEQELRLKPEQIRASRKVLRDYGNMSSATSLFVLKEILDTPARMPGGESVCAMAFGPGLTVEMALLRLT